MRGSLDPGERDFFIRRKDGTDLPVEVALSTLESEEGLLAVAAIRDISERRRAQEIEARLEARLHQSERLESVGQLAGGIAHDFNNILAAILGRTQLLLRSMENPEIRRQLVVIEQAALDGASTVRRVQEFTRLRQDEHFETVDIGQVLHDVVEFTRPAWMTNAKKRGIHVEIRQFVESGQPVAGNASELREVFTNLILNALDAMPFGGLILVTSQDTGDRVVVRVRDTGIGMDAETQARIFDPFFTTKPVKGTGLGLSVAYGIVEEHRGRIEVESQMGVGTNFKVFLPVG